ncbi:MAG: hypothetical protein QOF25_279 [Mycobacterium sp.]|jgi:hypothetical protein|nr:hypothetical protein [Mycobacterium sp.]
MPAYAVMVEAAITPHAIDPGLDGKQILSTISDGGMSAGPICQLLSATVTSSEDRIWLAVSPQPWMANPLGAMQGGVIAAIVGQLHTIPGSSTRWLT